MIAAGSLGFQLCDFCKGPITTMFLLSFKIVVDYASFMCMEAGGMWVQKLLQKQSRQTHLDIDGSK